jgi:adiponectin receptor
MFVAMGLSAVFPVLHGMELYGINEMRGRIGLTWLVLQGVLYILGAGLYAVSFLSFISNSMMWVRDRDRDADDYGQARWPERSSPGSFDIWGSSHQDFHVLVVLAAASHLYGLIRAFDFHHGIGGFEC